MPAVTLFSKPNGEPMATTHSPTRVRCRVAEANDRQIVGVDAQHGDVGQLVEADDLGLEFALVGQLDGDLVGIVDDVRVGQDQPVGADDEARTHAARRRRRAASGMPKRRKNSNIGSFGSIVAAVFDGPLTLILTTAGPLRSTMALKSGSPTPDRGQGAAAGAATGAAKRLGGADDFATELRVAGAESGDQRSRRADCV
jgi:hypothetical protein